MMLTIQQQMSKNEIDIYFTSQLPMLRKIIDGTKFKKHKLNIETDIVISECYLHIEKYKKDIKTENELQRMMVNFCVQNLNWTQSKINKEARVNEVKPSVELPKSIEENELATKELIEEWYEEKMDILNQYIEQEHDPYNRILFECIINKKITKLKPLGEHLKINKDTAAVYKKKLFKAINDFINNNNKLN